MEINNLGVSLTNVPSGHDYLLNEMELEDLGLLELAALNPDEAEINFIEEEPLLELLLEDDEFQPSIEFSLDTSSNIFSGQILVDLLSQENLSVLFPEKEFSLLPYTVDSESNLEVQKFLEDNRQAIILLNESDKHKLNDYLFDVDALTDKDIQFAEILLNLLQNNDLMRIETLDKARELGLGLDFEVNILDFFDNKFISNELIDFYIDMAVSDSVSVDKLNYLSLNKFEISSLNQKEQTILFNMLADSEGEIEHDLLFANSFQNFAAIKDNRRLELLDKSRSGDLTAAEEEQFIGFLWKDIELADMYLSLALEDAPQSKLDFLSNNANVLMELDHVTKSQLYEMLLDGNNLTEQDSSFAESFLLLSQSNQEDRLELLEKASQSNLTGDQELNYINALSDDKLSAKFLDAYLHILETQDLDKIKFFNENKYLIATFDEEDQDKVLRYIRDRRDLTSLDLGFAASLIQQIQNKDTNRIELLDAVRALDISAANEQRLMGYINDPLIASSFIKANLSLITLDANPDKLAFLETNRYRISSLSELQQDKVFQYLLDSESMTGNDIRFTQKLLNFLESNNSWAVDILDLARSKNLSSQEETAFLDYVAITNLSSKLLPEEMSAYIEVVAQESVQYSFVYNELLKRGDFERLELLKNTTSSKQHPSKDDFYYSYLLDNNLSEGFLKAMSEALNADLSEASIDLIHQERYSLSNMSDTLCEIFFKYLQDSSEETSEDRLYASALLKLTNDKEKLDILAESRKLDMNKEQEKSFLDLLLDDSSSNEMAKNYLRLVEIPVVQSTLDFFLENRFMINSYEIDEQRHFVDFLLKQKIDDQLQETLSVLLEKGDSSKFEILYENYDDISSNDIERARFLEYLEDDKISKKVLGIYIDLLSGDANSAALQRFDQNKYSLSLSSETFQDNAIQYFNSDNADLFFQLLRNKNSDKLSFFESYDPGSLTTDRERSLMALLLDKNVSLSFSKVYLNTLQNHSDSDTSTLLMNNRYKISALSDLTQNHLLDLALNGNFANDKDSQILNILLSRQDEGKLQVLLNSIDMDLDDHSKNKFYEYLADRFLSTSFVNAFLDISSQENNDEKLLYLDKNRYHLLAQGSLVRDKALDLLVGDDSPDSNDIENVNLYLRYQMNKNPRSSSLFDSFLEANLSFEQRDLLKEMLIDQRISRSLTQSLLNLSVDGDKRMANHLMKVFKSNYNSLSSLSIDLQDALADHLEPSNVDHGTREILHLISSIADRFNLSEDNNLALLEILQGTDSLSKLRNFTDNNKDLALRVDDNDPSFKQFQRNTLFNQAILTSKSLGLKFGDISKSSDDSLNLNFEYINHLIRLISQKAFTKLDNKQEQEQIQLMNYQVRLGLYNNLIQEETNKGDKADLAKISVLQINKAVIQDKIQQFSNSDKTVEDPYLEYQVNKIKDTLASLMTNLG